MRPPRGSISNPRPKTFITWFEFPLQNLLSIKCVLNLITLAIGCIQDFFQGMWNPQLKVGGLTISLSSFSNRVKLRRSGERVSELARASKRGVERATCKTLHVSTVCFLPSSFLSLLPSFCQSPLLQPFVGLSFSFFPIPQLHLSLGSDPRSDRREDKTTWPDLDYIAMRTRQRVAWSALVRPS